MDMSPFEKIVGTLIGSEPEVPGPAGLRVLHQFLSEGDTSLGVCQRMNAAFLIRLSGGQAGRRFEEAIHYLSELSEDGRWGRVATFFLKAGEIIGQELERASQAFKGFERQLVKAASLLSPASSQLMGVKDYWNIFFPEGMEFLGNDKAEKVEQLRKRRVVTIKKLAERPISNPAREILLTSNILLTVPLDVSRASRRFPHLASKLEGLRDAPQAYWYDHPVPVDAPPETNEIIHGLTELDRAMEFEKDRGTMAPGSKLCCVLSVSVTHKGLHDLARPVVTEMLREGPPLKHLCIHLWTETETQALVNKILAPAARNYFGMDARELLGDIIGVDGEYGRHFSFLKAVAAAWKLFKAPYLKATFKIDLDQAFAQKALVRETSLSALEHFKTPLWGAEGVDQDGREVFLGMIAGALVNRGDIGRSLFTPDVGWPEGNVRGEKWIFHSQLPQAASTLAEMMARYDGSQGLDGATRCIHRVHVTGGTCGILIEALRKYRPFTPTFIGRAEDQAYLLSVIFNDSLPALRYVHKDGLIMRHDKDLVSQRAIEVARPGKFVGDLARIILFTYYTKALPWDVEVVKGVVDPFTGCFISRLPFTVSALRMAFKAAELFEEGASQEACHILEIGASRLGGLMERLSEEANPLQEEYARQKMAWDLYFDIIDKVEEGLAAGDEFATSLRQRFLELVEKTRIQV